MARSTSTKSTKAPAPGNKALDLALDVLVTLGVADDIARERPDLHRMTLPARRLQPGVTALNAKVWVQTTDGEQFFEITSVRGMYSTSEHIAHFGLGDHKKAEKVIVEWPDGKRNEYKNQKANVMLEVYYSRAKSHEFESPELLQPLFSNQTK